MIPLDFGSESELIPDVIEPLVGYRAFVLNKNLNVSSIGMLDFAKLIRSGLNWTSFQNTGTTRDVMHHSLCYAEDEKDSYFSGIHCGSFWSDKKGVYLYNFPYILRSFNDTVWIPNKKQTARCGLVNRGYPHDVPCSHEDFTLTNNEMHARHSGYGCGIYSFKTLEECLKNNRRINTYLGESYVFAKIKLWGKVFEHEFGYRSSEAQIEELLAPSRRKYKFYYPIRIDNEIHPKSEKIKADKVNESLSKAYDVPISTISKKELKKEIKEERKQAVKAYFTSSYFRKASLVLLIFIIGNHTFINEFWKFLIWSIGYITVLVIIGKRNL